jgi:hypothetical protein
MDEWMGGWIMHGLVLLQYSMASLVLPVQLLQQEIIDETDRFMDNEQLQQVDPNQVSRLLPDNLRLVSVAVFLTGMPACFACAAAAHMAHPIGL